MNNTETLVLNDVVAIALKTEESKDPQPPHKEIFRTKRSYIPVELEKRQRLIKAVEEEGLTIKEAAQNLKINYSTAKHIVKVYKRTGEITTQTISKRFPERDVHQLETLTYA